MTREDLIEREVKARLVTVTFLFWLSGDLNPGETSADRLAAIRRLAEAALARAGERNPDVFDVILDGMEAGRGG